MQPFTDIEVLSLIKISLAHVVPTHSYVATTIRLIYRPMLNFVSYVQWQTTLKRSQVIKIL